MNKKLISALLITTVLSSLNVVNANTLDNKKDLMKNTNFPQKLETIINLPGKREFIEIPIQKDYYLNNIVPNLSSPNDYGKKMKDSFLKFTELDNEILNAQFKTEGRQLEVSIKDIDTGYFYDYNFGNGYVFETTTSILVNNGYYDENYSDKLKYIQDKVDKYLISQGYTNTTSAIGKFFNSSHNYEKGDIMIKTYEQSWKSNYWVINARNKVIEKNKKEIDANTLKNDISREYSKLDEILAPK